MANIPYIFNNIWSKKMKFILNNMGQKEFIKEYCIRDNKICSIKDMKDDDFSVKAIIKNINNNAKIKQLVFKKNVEFTIDGKRRIEPAILKFNNINKKGMLYSYEYEFAMRNFAKNYVKDEYETEEVTVQALQHTDLYKTVEEKIPLNPSLEETWENPFENDIFMNFYFLTTSFDEYLYPYNFVIEEKYYKPKFLLAKMFVESLKFDKFETVNYKLDKENRFFELFTSKPRLFTSKTR